VPRLTKVYYSAYQPNLPHESTMQDTEIRTYSVDWNGALEGSTVSGTPDWATEDTSVITIASEAVSSGVSTVKVTAAETGTADLSCTATLANGLKLMQWFRIRVQDAGALR
jgi:hypothetical protein